GRSGCCAADGLLRPRPDLRIDLIDRLPTPFGLVRLGVAPDHQGTKAIVRQFEKATLHLTYPSSTGRFGAWQTRSSPPPSSKTKAAPSTTSSLTCGRAVRSARTA